MKVLLDNALSDPKPPPFGWKFLSALGLIFLIAAATFYFRLWPQKGWIGIVDINFAYWQYAIFNAAVCVSLSRNCRKISLSRPAYRLWFLWPVVVFGVLSLVSLALSYKQVEFLLDCFQKRKNWSFSFVNKIISVPLLALVFFEVALKIEIYQYRR